MSTTSAVHRAPTNPDKGRERKQVSIRDVAAAANVSVKMVSRVLRGEAYVAPAKRELVERVSQQLGYTPNLSARNLRSNVASVVGLVWEEPAKGDSPRLSNEYVMTLQMGVMRACQDLDFGMMFVPVPMEVDRALTVLRMRHRARHVGGFVIPAPIVDLPGLLEGLEAEGIPYSAISPVNVARASHWVAAQERGGARDIAAYLISQGHTNIGFIRCDIHNRATTEREAGYRDAMHEAGLEPKRDWLYSVRNFTFDEGRRCGEQILASPDRPTAVFAINDEVAAGVIAAAHEHGLQLPNDLSIVSYDDRDLARKLWPNLTTVHQPLEELGETSARQLVARLHPLRRAERPYPSEMVLPCRVVKRSSVAPMPRSRPAPPNPACQD